MPVMPDVIYGLMARSPSCLVRARWPFVREGVPVRMSIQRRLAISITLVLLFSLVVGCGLTYQHVLSKVGTEMRAALTVAVDSALNGLDATDDVGDPLKRLRRIVADFDGDRHVTAILTTPTGDTVAQSRLLQPEDAAPRWFYRLVFSQPSSQPSSKDLALPPRYRSVGKLRLVADAHNEIAEAWSDARLTLTIMGIFFAMVLTLAFVTIKAALSPIRDVSVALSRIGTGDYTARLAPRFSRELLPLRDGFNGMAVRLEQMSVQNRALTEQIITLQDEERAELARDLHDDVAPFLFAVGADAAMIRTYVSKGSIDLVGPRADAIAEAVRHMQRRVKDVLRRLAPGALLDLGLAGAIDDLFGFWRTRRPLVAFSSSVTGDPLDPPFDALAFRIVQESLSNAIRHGDPRTIDVTIDCDDERAMIVVEDDGGGFGIGEPAFGFGLTGMQERARSAGGTMAVRNRMSPRGVIVEVTLPIVGREKGLDRSTSESRPARERRGLDVPA